MKRSEIAISASLVPIDYIMVVLAGLASYYVRYLESVQTIRPVIFDLPFEPYLKVIWLMALIWPVSFWLAGLYSMRGTRRTVDEISKIILGCSTAIMILMLVFFFGRSIFDSRFIIVAAWIISIIFVVIGRSVVRFIQHFFYKFDIGVHRVVVLGNNRVANEAVENFNTYKKSGYKVVAQFPNYDNEVENQLTEMVKDDKFDEILVATPDFNAGQTERINDFSYINHIILKYIADIFDFPINNFEINNISGMPIVEVKKTSLDGWGKIYKRIFDIKASALIIIVLSPILLLVAVAIKIDSRGPVFFKYKRIGQFGKPFTYFKFRSMISDAHKYRFDEEFLKEHQNIREGTPMMKFKDDPRITRVGKIIRRFSIDELPELFNVFIGKMSLVGPRPHEVEEVERYQVFHKKILAIKPGMTGMAQVSGRSDLDFDDEVKLDIWYMENWSMKLDVMILFKTPWAVLKKRKAD